MKKKKSIIKRIDIIFILYIIIGMILQIITAVQDGSLRIGFEAPQTNLTPMEVFIVISSFILVAIVFLWLYLFSFLIEHYLSIALYIGFRFAYKKHYLDKLDITDFNTDGYYRDIIKEYSPAVLSYIEDFKLSDKDVIATLMALEIKGKIKIGNTIEVVNTNFDLLESNEQYVLEELIKGQLKNIDYNQFQNKVIEDCLKDGLLINGATAKKKKKTLMFKLLAAFLVYVLIFVLVLIKFNGKTIDSILLLSYIMISMPLIVFCIIATPITIYMYHKTYSALNAINPYIRSKKAKIINTNLKGLKNFIRDFSKMDNSEHREIILWKEYLIYSVIFNSNEKVVNEMMSKI